jgi:hypothetical protein
MAGMPALFEPLPLSGIALARGFLDDPRRVWHAAAALGADAVYPPQYLRARPEHRGAARTPYRPAPGRR